VQQQRLHLAAKLRPGGQSARMVCSTVVYYRCLMLTVCKTLQASLLEGTVFSLCAVCCTCTCLLCVCCLVQMRSARA
jgi:hypothetical protein